MADTQGPKPSSTWLEQVNHSSATEDPQQDPEPMWLQKRFSEPEKQQQQSWLGAKHKEINRTERWKISPAATGVGMSKCWSISPSRGTDLRTAQKCDGRKLAFNSHPLQLSVFLPSSNVFRGLSWFWVPSLPPWRSGLCAPCSAKPGGSTANPRQRVEQESSHGKVWGCFCRAQHRVRPPAVTRGRGRTRGSSPQPISLHQFRNSQVEHTSETASGQGKRGEIHSDQQSGPALTN